MNKEKDLKLVNIYIKIHNKKVLTLDDLAYLAKFNPECFKKTCDNLIYKIPKTKSLVKPADEQPMPKAPLTITAAPKGNALELTADEKFQIEHTITQFFNNMKKLESNEIDSLQNIDAGCVKELVGDLFMENLFPHSGKEEYFDISLSESACTFNVTA